MSARVELRLPPRFYEDHMSRDCEDGAQIATADRSQELRETSKGVIVSMTHAGIAELWSDADYYASEMGGNYPGLASSARATLRAIRDQYPPAAGWRLDPRIRL
jgi:hypothetical protein